MATQGMSQTTLHHQILAYSYKKLYIIGVGVGLKRSTFFQDITCQNDALLIRSFQAPLE